MAKYQVHAVRRDTGESTSIEVTAEDEQQATEIAAAQGLDVQTVHLVGDQPAPPPVPEPAMEMDEQAEAGAYDSFPLIPPIDAMLGQARSALSQPAIDALSRLAMLIGLWALVGFAGLMVVIGIVVSIDLGSAEPLGPALAMAVLGLALLYTAAKFGHSGLVLIRSSPSAIASGAFLDAVAVLGLVVGAVVLIGGIVLGIAIGNVNPVWYGLVGSALLLLLASMALNPAMVNCSLCRWTSAGREFLGILEFVTKVVVRMVPVVFGVAIAVGTVLLAIDLIRFLAGDEFARMQRYGTMMFLGGLVLVAAGLPLLVYVVATLHYLCIEIARAILGIPDKLDSMRR